MALSMRVRRGYPRTGQAQTRPQALASRDLRTRSRKGSRQRLGKSLSQHTSYRCQVELVWVHGFRDFSDDLVPIISICKDYYSGSLRRHKHGEGSHSPIAAGMFQDLDSIQCLDFPSQAHSCRYGAVSDFASCHCTFCRVNFRFHEALASWVVARSAAICFVRAPSSCITLTTNFA